MRDYVIMTDSCCDLTADMAREMELEVLPLTMRMDDREYPNYLDGRAITNEEFYRRLRAGKMSSTAAVNIHQFEERMGALLESGKDVVCICFSSALSTTYQSAVIASGEVLKTHPNGAVHVIDSLSASLGQGLLLYLAVQKKREGLTASELVDWVEQNKLRVCHWFTVDDLNFLKRGGRLSAGAALVGTMLAIKPVMHTSNEGKLVPMAKVRGRKASLKALMDKVGELGVDLPHQTMFICHADCLDEAEQVAASLKERYGVPEIHINYIGPVIGSHTGPNTMGLFFLGKER